MGRPFGGFLIHLLGGPDGAQIATAWLSLARVLQALESSYGKRVPRITNLVTFNPVGLSGSGMPEFAT